MARIAEYRAQAGLNPAPRPNVSIRSNGGLVSDIGAGISQVGGAILERQQRREAFKANADYKKLHAQLDQEMFEAEQNISEGGEGFHERFMRERFQPALENFRNALPDNPELRQQFEAALETDEIRWNTAAAKTQTKEVYRYQTQVIGDGMNDLAQKIALDPESYDAYHAQLAEMIESSNLPAPERAKLMDLWEQTAMTSYLNERMKTDPHAVMRELGGDATSLSPESQAMLMQGSISAIVDDIGLDGDRVPGTGMRIEDVRAIAKREDEGNVLPEGASAEEWGTYLASSPEILRAYSKAHLRDMQAKFGSDQQAVLVGYFEGEKAAKSWVEGGRDPALLNPKVRKAVSDVDASISPASGIAASRVALTLKGKPAKVADFGRVDPDLIGAAQAAFAAEGHSAINVVSAERSRGGNRGATDSRHVVFDETTGKHTGHTGALDILWPKGATTQDKIALIRRLSSMGVQGIGIYKNNIHIDFGGRRSWGSDYKSGSIPNWAKGVIAEHMTGAIPHQPTRNVDARFAKLDEGARQKFLGAAAKSLDDQAAEDAPSLAERRAALKDIADEHIASIRRSGEGLDGFDERQAMDMLTPDQARTFRDNVYVARNVHARTDGLETMPEASLTSIQAQTNALRNTGFDRDERIANEVDRAVREVREERLNSPARAAHNDPAVASAWEQVMQTATTGGIDTPAMENYIRLSQEHQRRTFNLKPDQVQVVPDTVAAQMADAIMVQLNGEVKGTPAEKVAVRRNRMALIYAQAQDTYGEFADEVLIQALMQLAVTGEEGTPAEMFANALGHVARGNPPSWLDLSGASDTAPEVPSQPAITDDEKRAILNRVRRATQYMDREATAEYIDNQADPAMQEYLRRMLLR